MNVETVDPSSLFQEPPAPNPAIIARAGSVGPTEPGPGPTEPGAATDPVPPADRPEPTPADRSASPPETDDGGTPFDPSRHLHTRHPRTGRWMPRRQPRSATAGPTRPAEPFSFVAPDEPPAAEPEPGTAAAAEPTGPDVCTVMADLHCRAFYGLSVAFISDEWLASKEEHRTNVDTLAAYYRATNFRPDSPGWALLAQAVAFGGKRLPMPKTQSRLGMIRTWFARKWHAWRGSRRARALGKVQEEAA